MSQTATPLVHAAPELGPVPYTADDVLTFPEGVPGFEGLRAFLIVTREECAPFVFLASLERPEVALPLLPLALVTGPEAAGAALQAARAQHRALSDAAALYAVAGIARGATQVWVNLRAPVVVDLEARRGVQVILGDETLPVALPLGA
jgi:flagellar assembly factor FliW